MENKEGSNRNNDLEASVLANYEDMVPISTEKKVSTEMQLCQQLTDTLSISSELTHSLTPIPSLTDRTISISTNTNSLTRNYDYDTENIDENVKLTNWTTKSFYTSTEDMISSGIFDSDEEASGDDSQPRESISTREDSAYKWQDISTSDLCDDDNATVSSYSRMPKKTVDTSSEDEPWKPRRSRLFNIRMSEASDNSYPHSSNRTYSNLEDFQGFSSLMSDDEDVEQIEPSIYSVSNFTPRTNSELEDSPDATCSSVSSDVSVTDSIFDEIPEEGAENIEHNMIATRYGLPYDVIDCCCLAEAQIKRNREYGFKLCKSGSCHKFEEEFGELDGRAIRLWHTTKRLNGYKKACRIYNILVGKPDPANRRAFRKADYMLKVNFPHYWVHLSEKYLRFVPDEERHQENRLKEKVIEACERVLKEQEFFAQHYQVNMRDFGNNVKISVDYRHLHKDFESACEFLMKEYPSLFQHLMDKFNFEAFALKRLLIDENRKRLIEYAKKPQKVLMELEHAYFHESLEKIRRRNRV